MTSQESVPSSEPPSKLAWDNELPHLAQKLGSFLLHVGSASGKGNLDAEYAMAFGLAKDLAWNLGLSSPGSNIPEQCNKPSELFGIAFGVIPVIVNSPRLNRDQRLELIAGYPRALRKAGLFRTQWGAEDEVGYYMRSNYQARDMLGRANLNEENVALSRLVVARLRNERRERIRQHIRRFGDWLLGRETD